MGAGAGAAAAIDKNELSPRDLALEKAEAELRRDLAIREERRRELEFLEKGGEPLEFKFRDALAALPFLSLSPADPSGGGLLSEGGGGGDQNSVAIGGATTWDEGIVGGGGAPEEGRKSERSLEDEADLIGGQKGVDPAWRSGDVKAEVDGECCVGDSAGSESQMHVKRNRARSQRVGNGHAAPKEVENVAGADSRVAEVESAAPSGSVENEAMLDVSYEVLPRQSSHGLARKWSSLIISQELEAGKEARCGAVSEQVAAADPRSPRDSSPSRVSVQSADARVDASVDRDERDRASDCVGSAGPVDSCAPHVRKVGGVGETDGSASPKSVEDAPVVDAAPASSKEESGAESPTGSQQLRTEKKERVGLFSMEKGGDMHRVDGLSVLHAEGGADVLGGPNSHRSSGLIKKAASSRGGNHGRLASRDRLAQEEKRGGVHHARVKCEDGVAENRARPSAADAEPGGEQASGAPSSQEELRAEGQAGAVVGGIPRAIARSSSVSASSNCKYPGAVPPREKEQEPSAQAETERRKAEVQAKVETAHDDYILEEAENLEVA